MFGFFFDAHEEYDVFYRRKPHWLQQSVLVLVTYRLADSIPRSVIHLWNRQRDEWLTTRGYGVYGDYEFRLERLPQEIQRPFRKTFNRKRECFLDKGHGSCLLRDPINQRIVADALKYFDGQRYFLGDFIVMPNHVHLLAAFPNPEMMLTQYDSWLHFTAREINKNCGRKGKLWQGEPFDHLVRTPEQLDYLRKYIADNPINAGLSPGQWLYERR